jgi:hypothetical protein
MPFSFTWDNVSPADPTAANLLGKDIRDLRAAIQERMDSIFCDSSGPWLTSDPTHPLIAKPAIGGNLVGKHITIPHTAFVAPPVNIAGFFGGGGVNWVWTYNDLYATYVPSGSPGAGGSWPVYAAVIVPIGCTITGFSIFADPQGNTAIVGTLQDNVVYGTPAGYASGIIATATTPAASGLVLANSGAVSVSSTIAAVLYIKLIMPYYAFNSNNGRIYGAQITYNSLDSTTVY